MTAPKQLFLLRLGATIIDALVAGLLGFVGASVFVLSSYSPEELLMISSQGNGLTDTNPLLVQLLSSSFCVVLGVNLLYYFSEIVSGKTLGKYICKLKIVSQGEQTSIAKNLLMRYVIKHNVAMLHIIAMLITSEWLLNVASLLGLIIVVGFLGALGNAGLALHDLLSGTEVVSVQVNPTPA